MDQRSPDEIPKCENRAFSGPISPSERPHANALALQKTTSSTVGRRDVQTIFALVASSILIFGLLPLAAELLWAPQEHASDVDHPIAPVFLVDINSASAGELALLPQVGPVLAERIVAERAEGGPFQSVDELKRTRGMGAERINRLRPLLVAKPLVSPEDQGTYRAAKLPVNDGADSLLTPRADLGREGISYDRPNSP